MTLAEEADLAYRAGHAANRMFHEPTKAGRLRVPKASDVPRTTLNVGDRVKFWNDRRWWDVRAVGEDHAVLTRSGDFGREPVYTVIAWAEGRRGPHDSWGFGAQTTEECQEIVRAMASGELELSERRAIHLDLREVSP